MKGLKAYLGSVWNTIDLLQLISMACITISFLTDWGSSHKEGQRIIAAFSIFNLWLKFFDWLRMFESTAFYVSLLYRTLKDISDFMILFFVALAMFGSVMYMLQLNVKYENDDEIY